MALVWALLAGYGIHLLYTALALGWRGPAPGPSLRLAPRPRRSRDWLAQAGLADVRPVEFVLASSALAGVGAATGYLVFAGVVPTIALGGVGALLPAMAARHRRRARREQALDHWPRMIDELRVLTGAAGRSIPQALFEVGRRGPAELREAFATAEREWLLSTDFPRTLRVLKRQLADPTADATCETLLVAHDLGGADLDRRLAALADDRRVDARGRKDARTRQAGVRFARLFVLIVPLGMALAGMSVGDGRAAYATAAGQLGVALALGVLAACWIWASVLLRLPEEERVFPT